MKRPRPLLILSFVLAVFLAACTGGASPTNSPVSPVPEASSGAPNSASTQRSEDGQVTVEATWAGPAAGATFEVKLDTHSVDLGPLDLANALLRNDRGDRLTAEPWTAPKSGHHREGVLTFDGDVAAFLAGAKWIELVLTGVGGVPERILRWQIG